MAFKQKKTKKKNIKCIYRQNIICKWQFSIIQENVYTALCHLINLSCT